MHSIKLVITTGLFLAILVLLGACSQNNENGNYGEHSGNNNDIGNNGGNGTGAPEISNAATVSTLAGTAVGMGFVDATGSDARFRRPMGIVSDGDNLYIVDSWNNIIRKLVIATGEVTTFAGVARSQNFIDGVGDAARLFSPRGITILDNKIYFADRNTVRSIDIATREVVTIAGTFSLDAIESIDGIEQ